MKWEWLVISEQKTRKMQNLEITITLWTEHKNQTSLGIPQPDWKAHSCGPSGDRDITMI